MAAGAQSFFCLWQSETIRETLFELLPRDDICSVRLASSACCNLVTRRLFLRTHLNFTANSLTKPGRIQALSRIGHHVEHLTFHLAHSDATFLPPLVHPETGHEISFLYTPLTPTASVPARPKYGSPELADLLTQQYPPLFHAATDVPSFVAALGHMPNMRHLTVRTPGQSPGERYRRSAVDYALVSLRIAVEQAPLARLEKLSLSAVHPSALLYLRPVPGLGTSPSSPRRWRQIRKLRLSVEAWDFHGPSPGLDQLAVLDDYLRLFAPRLDKLAFAWLGRRGPCPLTLPAGPPGRARRLFAEVTSRASPLPPPPSPPPPARRPLVMPLLRCLSLRNAELAAAQMRDLAALHRPALRDLALHDVLLADGGSWADALDPLGRAWSRRPSPPARSPSTASSTVADDAEELLLPGPSAAVTAAGRELFAADLDAGIGLGGGGLDAPRAGGVRAWAHEVTEASRVRARNEAGHVGYSAHLRRRRAAHRTESRRGHGNPGSDGAHGRPQGRDRHGRRGGDDGDDEEGGGGAVPRQPSSPRPDGGISSPLPSLLLPAVYDPSAEGAGAGLAKRGAGGGLSAVQRSIEAELARTRAPALRRAREAVLARLASEFCGSGGGIAGGRRPRMKESAAVRGVPGMDLRPGTGAGTGTGTGTGMGCGVGGPMEGLLRSFGGRARSGCANLESRTALVPLIFSRS